MRQTNNLHVAGTNHLPSPDALKVELPLSARGAELVERSRREIQALLSWRDPRVLAIVGPCSIHDPNAALDYARRLLVLRERHADRLLVCMRVYFEKPRTSVGWKGLINDPHLDGSCDVATGLRRARTLLLELSELGMPAATETLDPFTPQYTSDLISWTAIGARTTESQTHREMASGLSMPVGFKNGTDGGLEVALNAMRAAGAPHSFIGIDGQAHASVVRTLGNPHCHVVLRGGESGPNYQRTAVTEAARRLAAAGMNPRVLIDCSHDNSRRNHENQSAVVADVAGQLAESPRHILGIMLESQLVAGRQDLAANQRLVYGQSITDACIDVETTARLLDQVAQATGGRKYRAPRCVEHAPVERP